MTDPKQDPVVDQAISSRLIPCKICDRQISKKADFCPQCGYKNRRFNWWWVKGSILILGILFVLFHDAVHRVLPIPDFVDFLLHRVFGAD